MSQDRYTNKKKREKENRWHPFVRIELHIMVYGHRLSVFTFAAAGSVIGRVQFCIKFRVAGRDGWTVAAISKNCTGAHLKKNLVRTVVPLLIF